MKKLTLTIAAFSAALGYAGSAEAYYGANQQCREYTRTIYVGGRAQEGFGTACLQPDGSWQIVGEPQVQATLPPTQIVERVVIREPVYVPAPYYGYSNYYAPRSSGLTISLGNRYGSRGHGYHHRSRGHDRHYSHRDRGSYYSSSGRHHRR